LRFTACIFCLCLLPPAAGADTQVFTVTSPQPEQVLQTVRSLYGDRVRADLIQQRLVVVGSRAQLAEIGTLLAQLDRPPQALRLTLREQPPLGSSITYGTDGDGLSVDTVAGALVTLERSQLTQQPAANGWWITVDNVPVEFSSVMLQIQLQGERSAQVLVSYTREQNQQRRVFGNTVSGTLGTWLPLLPQSARPEADDKHGRTYSTGPKPGTQLYLRIDPITAQQSRGG